MGIDLSLSSLGVTGGGSLVRGLFDTGATNLLTNAQAFDNVAWSELAGLPVVANTTTAPDGTSTADKFLPDTTSANHGIYQGTGGVGAGTFTFSVYAKAAGYPRAAVRVYDGTVYQIRTTFDISNGTIVSIEAGSASITAAGNGWYLISGTGTTAANMGNVTGFMIESLPAGQIVQNTFAGDGVSGTYLWQGQVVAGSAIGPINYR